TAIDTIIEQAGTAAPRRNAGRGNADASAARNTPAASTTARANALLARPPRRAAPASSDEEAARQQTVVQRIEARRAAHAELARRGAHTDAIAAVTSALPGLNARRFVVE